MLWFSLVFKINKTNFRVVKLNIFLQNLFIINALMTNLQLNSIQVNNFYYVIIIIAHVFVNLLKKL